MYGILGFNHGRVQYSIRRGVGQVSKKEKKEERKRCHNHMGAGHLMGYTKCPKCGKKAIGNRQSWFFEFTGQGKGLCSRCMKIQKGGFF